MDFPKYSCSCNATFPIEGISYRKKIQQENEESYQVIPQEEKVGKGVQLKCPFCSKNKRNVQSLAKKCDEYLEHRVRNKVSEASVLSPRKKRYNVSDTEKSNGLKPFTNLTLKVVIELENQEEPLEFIVNKAIYASKTQDVSSSSRIKKCFQSIKNRLVLKERFGNIINIFLVRKRK